MTSAAEVAEAFYSERRSGVDPRKVPVRFSNLKEMGKSPAHYRTALDEDRESTLSLKLGAGAHAILFDKPWVVYTGKVRNGKAWEAFASEHAGSVILNQREYNEAQSMVDSLRAHPLAMELLRGVTEQRLTWCHELQNRACAGTPDVFTQRRVVELKTGRSAEPVRFVRQGLSLSYHAQLAWYMDGVRLSGSGTPTEAYIVAVESSRPHPVTVLRLTERALDQGRRLCRLWMERLLVCEAFDRWPPYVECEVPFDVEDAGDFTLRIDGEETEVE